MSKELFSESHILLTQPEFADAFHNVGYDRSLGNKLFILLINSDLTPRSASSIGYREENREGKMESYISITNLAKVAPQMENIYQMGAFSVEAAFEVIESILLPQTEQALAPTHS